jgi:hypothetical protein
VKSGHGVALSCNWWRGIISEAEEKTEGKIWQAKLGLANSKEEFARRGDTIYERDIRRNVEEEHEGEFVAIDVETGAYEVDANELAASDRLGARIPNPQIWLKRVGSRYVRHFGPRPQSSTL